MKIVFYDKNIDVGEGKAQFSFAIFTVATVWQTKLWPSLIWSFVC